MVWPSCFSSYSWTTFYNLSLYGEIIQISMSDSPYCFSNWPWYSFQYSWTSRPLHLKFSLKTLHISDNRLHWIPCPSTTFEDYKIYDSEQEEEVMLISSNYLELGHWFNTRSFIFGEGLLSYIALNY